MALKTAVRDHGFLRRKTYYRILRDRLVAFPDLAPIWKRELSEHLLGLSPVNLLGQSLTKLTLGGGETQLPCVAGF